MKLRSLALSAALAVVPAVLVPVVPASGASNVNIANGVRVAAHPPFPSGGIVFGIGSVQPLTPPVRARMVVLLSHRGRVIAHASWTVLPFSRYRGPNAIAAKAVCRKTRTLQPWTTVTYARSTLAGRSRAFVVRSRVARIRCLPGHSL